MNSKKQKNKFKQEVIYVKKEENFIETKEPPPKLEYKPQNKKKFPSKNKAYEYGYEEEAEEFREKGSLKK